MRIQPVSSLRPLPYRDTPRRDRLAAGVRASAYGTRTSPAQEGDVEVSIRVIAEAGSVTVMRRTALAADGQTRQTIGIDAVIR